MRRHAGKGYFFCGLGGGGGGVSVCIMCTFSRRGIVLYFQQCVELNGNAIKKH